MSRGEHLLSASRSLLAAVRALSLSADTLVQLQADGIPVGPRPLETLQRRKTLAARVEDEVFAAWRSEEGDEPDFFGGLSISRPGVRLNAIEQTGSM